jgi:hypothetical protein
MAIQSFILSMISICLILALHFHSSICFDIEQVNSKIKTNSKSKISLTNFSQQILASTVFGVPLKASRIIAMKNVPKNIQGKLGHSHLPLA